MGKLDALHKLEALGLNTPELLFSLPAHDDFERRKIAWDGQKKTHHLVQNSKVSIRTERPGVPATPHFPNISIRSANRHVLRLLDNPYMTIHVFKPINPLDCIRRGSIMFMSDGKIYAEWLEGPGTVRDIEKAGLGNPNFRSDSLPVGAPLLNVSPLVRNIFKICLLHQQSFKDQIVEWSIYSVPVGRLHHPEIFWEIRPWR